MSDFEWFDVESLEEGLGLLDKHAGEASVLAGGTDLHILMSMNVRAPRFVVSIGRIPELRQVLEQDGRVRIGATVTHAELGRCSVLQSIRSLCKAAASIGSPQIRNMGTAGGNIANASPAADLYPPLLTLEATAMLRSSKGAREVALCDFATGPGSTRIGPDEMITGLEFEAPAGEYHTDFVKIGLRNALAVSVASAAIFATGENGRFKDVRIACGAVAPRPLRMRQVEAVLAGQTPTKALVSQAAQIAREECDPISDIRATGEYRRHVAGVLVSRLVEDAGRGLMGRSLSMR